MRILFPLSLLLSIVLFSNGCKKDDPSTTYNLTVIPHYHVDGDELTLDTILYQNAAGNPYSVNKLRYYLSNFRFVKADNSEISADNNAHFIDAREATSINLVGVPPGNFTALRFNFGIPQSQNVYGNLPNTSFNTGMVWPEQMGGGYHFMKFEGYFNSSQGVNGYAIHVGNNACIAEVTITTPFEISEDGDMTIGFNLNEIMAGPNTFDMDSSNYTMGIMDAMLEISENVENAFTIEQTP